MRTFRHLPATLAACLAAAALPGCGDVDSGTAAAASDAFGFGQVAFEPCSLQDASGLPPVEARCGSLDVPENPAEPDGRTITLDIAWLPAGDGSGAAQPDPVFFLAGGPGQAATRHAGIVQLALGEVARQRDILLVDQRGTGDSHPLQCRDAQGEPMQLESMTAPDQEQLVAFAKACAQGLEGYADPRFYTTTDAVRDLDAVRAALGVDRINLVGVSYGTRVAQQYAATHPERTRTLVLDGVVPNPLVVGAEFADTLDRTLALHSERCHQLPACRERFPRDMRAQLRTVMARLLEEPVEVDYRNPRTGAIEHGTVTADAVGGLAFMFSYLPQTASLLPLVVDEAAQGRYAPLMSLLQLSSTQMQGQMTQGMQWSVVCAEDAGRYRPGTGPTGDAAATVIGGELADAFFAPCRAWPHGQAPAGFHEPLRSEVPALLASGELDPVTPPRYGEQVLAGLPNGRHLVLEGQGHNVSHVGCMPELLGRFVESADASALDTACLDDLRYLPPFVNFNGWAP